MQADFLLHRLSICSCKLIFCSITFLFDHAGSIFAPPSSNWLIHIPLDARLFTNKKNMGTLTFMSMLFYLDIIIDEIIPIGHLGLHNDEYVQQNLLLPVYSVRGF